MPVGPLLFDALPTVASAMEQSLIDEGERALALALRELRIHALCGCGAADCMSFYLAVPTSPCSGRYRVVFPAAVMTVGVCDEQIGWVQDEAFGEGPETTQRLLEYRRLLDVAPRAMSGDPGHAAS